MTRVIATITASVDGYITGPDDGPAQGLGRGGERLHYWVFGGPGTYAGGARGEATGEDKAFFDEAMTRVGAVIGGRGTYEAADHWGGTSPWPVPFFVVTHRPDEEPATGGFTFVGSLTEAVDRARAAAGDRDVSLMGGADLIRQALHDGLVDQLSISIAPVTLGAGKRLFEGFQDQLELEPIGVRQSPYATHISYRVKH
ncbi:MAG TPA: dihydrofolate reductase family protein [Candidatus Sulfotelmatobacter sp.]|nr:dihydrofolate reductase family protein [Candidatus Sulfotelmatobacter sp.]